MFAIPGLVTWRLTCVDSSNLVFSYYISAPTRESAERKVADFGWKVKSAHKEYLHENIIKQLKGEETHASRTSIKNLISFYRQFGTMYDNNVDIKNCLAICAESSEDVIFRQVLKKINMYVEGGEDLASAMARYPRIFDKLTAITVRAAQTGGYIGKAMISLSAMAKLSYEVDRKLKNAAIYPTAILVLAIVEVLIFSFKVIPQFIPMYKAAGSELPFPTKVMMLVSEVLTGYPILGVLLGLLPIVLFLKKKDIAIQPWCQTLFHKLPGIKHLTRAVYLSRYSRMMAQLTEANIQFVQQMSMMRDGSAVKMYSIAFEAVKKDLEGGTGLTAALAKFDHLLSPFFIGNVRAGESSGNISDNLIFVADFYEEEALEHLKNLNAMLEPALTMMIGGIIGFLMMAMFMPLFDMGNLVLGKKTH